MAEAENLSGREGWGDSSARVSHSPHEGQRPSHFWLPAPQAWQTKMVRDPVRAKTGVPFPLSGAGRRQGVQVIPETLSQPDPQSRSGFHRGWSQSAEPGRRR